MADGSADPAELVGRHAGAHSGAAHEHAPLGLPGEHGLPKLLGYVGVVHRRFRRFDAEIEDVVTGRADGVGDAGPEFHAAMVEGDCYAHREGTLPR
jgi:hypothetical protein